MTRRSRDEASSHGASAFCRLSAGDILSPVFSGSRGQDGRGTQRSERTRSEPRDCGEALLSRIMIDPTVCHGKPTIRGLRYPVEAMLEYLAGGDTFEDILAEFPDLAREDLQACIQFAAQSLKL